MQDMMRRKCLGKRFTAFSWYVSSTKCVNATGLGFWEKHTYRLRQSQKYGLDDDETMLEVLKDIIFERKKAASNAEAKKKGKAKKGTKGSKDKKIKVKGTPS